MGQIPWGVAPFASRLLAGFKHLVMEHFGDSAEEAFRFFDAKRKRVVSMITSVSICLCLYMCMYVCIVYIHISVYIYIYIYIEREICMSIYLFRGRERERDAKRKRRVDKSEFVSALDELGFEVHG